MINEIQEKPTVLIVDDTPENIDVLGQILSDYKRLFALNGAKALQIAKNKLPDLILLDIMMPEMDGFEVCRLLKSDPDTANIPIIFITAKNQIEDEVLGLKLGAVDFISKPISLPIVQARVKAHLDFSKSKQKVELKNSELALTLKELKETQNQLIFSEKMASLGQLVASIAHEINTPLGAISSSNQCILNEVSFVLKEFAKTTRNLDDNKLELFSNLVSQSLIKNNVLSSLEERNHRKNLIIELESLNINNAKNIADLFVELGIYNGIVEYNDLFSDPNLISILSAARSLSNLNSSANVIKMAVEKVSKLVFALKNFSRHDSFATKKETDINLSIDGVLTLYQNLLKQGINVEKDFQLNELVNCFTDEINQVWTNIIHNAIQAMKNKGNLFIGTYKENDFVKIIIKDDGQGIPDKIKKRIYEPFFTTKHEGEGTGLGLSIVTKIIDKHNGKIEVESKLGAGSEFRIYLPTNYES